MGNNNSSILLSDEELGKKYDDHRADSQRHGRVHLAGWTWPPARIQPRKVLKRLLVLAGAVFLIYSFVTHIPTDVPIRDHRRPSYQAPPPASNPEIAVSLPPKDSAESEARPSDLSRPLSPADASSSARPGLASADATAPQTDGGGASSPRFYRGPISFLDLSDSLKALGSTTQAATKVNRNVLFAAASLKSAGALLQVACEMGRARRNNVQFSLMGGSDISLDNLRRVNGVDETCQITFHDARPNLAPISTDVRLGDSVIGALRYIHAYMHPQVVIVDSLANEELFFKEALAKHTRVHPTPLIEVPTRDVERFQWMTKLDSASLAAWNDVNVDVLIHVPPKSAGGLIRLLKSLSAADFHMSSIPHLTIELSQMIDAPTERFLRAFRWPPPSFGSSQPPGSQLSLRHRIAGRGLDEEESSARFVESFWPAISHHSHVLVLSPQVELSRDFFHYLKYAILEYKYSIVATMQEWDRHLLGISLELPQMFLNATLQFDPPLKTDATGSGGRARLSPTPFLWQAPNSNAALYFGDKWKELHALVSRTLVSHHNYEVTPSPGRLPGKLVSKMFPAWLEHALRLSLARGYFTLYPSGPVSELLATVHVEKYRLPEEYETDPRHSKKAEDAKDALAKEASTWRAHGADSEVVLSSRGSILNDLPGSGTLPSFNDLPIVSWNGDKKRTTTSDFHDDTLEFAKEFRQTVGGCHKDDVLPPAPPPSVADLFCST